MTDNTASPASTPADSSEGLPNAGGEIAHDAGTGISVHVRRNTNMYVYASGAQREGVLATARPGLHDPEWHKGKLGPETVVRIDGREMNLRSAERLGHVVRDHATGEYRDAKLVKAPNAKSESAEADATPEGDPKDSEGDQESGPAMLPEADERDLNTLLTFAQENGVRPMLVASEFIADPSRLPASALAIARKHNISEAELKGHVDRISASFTRLAASVVEKAGVTYDEVVAWEANNVPQSVQNRGRLLAFKGDMGYFRELAKTYKNQSTPKPKNLPAGVTYREAKHPADNRKVTLVKVPGHREMTIETATQMGLL